MFTLISGKGSLSKHDRKLIIPFSAVEDALAITTCCVHISKTLWLLHVSGSMPIREDVKRIDEGL